MSDERTINIDFRENIVYANEWPLTETHIIEEMLKAGGYDPKDFVICSVLNTEVVEFENDNTGDFQIQYEMPKNEVN